ncbi:MAG TPA: hypothetical protein VGB82_10930 [Alphaproteobacteria bacterium]
MKSWMVLAVSTALLAGCDQATFPLSGGGTGLAPGSGIERSMSGVTYKTFAAPVSTVGKAVLQSLNYMDIGLAGVQKTEQSWQIAATAGKRRIDIQLEALTSNMTAMRVTVDRGDQFFKDGATATEIVLQTADALASRNNFGQAAADAAPAEAAPAALPARAKKRRF